MTSPETKPTSRKRLLLTVTLAILLLSGVWVTYFLAKLDLNNYRQQAEQELSALLALPVKIGSLDYNLHDTNLALHITDLKVGDNASRIRVDTPNILINLKWSGLLERDLRFAKISLIQPQVWLQAAGRHGDDSIATAEASELKFDRGFWESISIHGLEILGGTVKIDLARPDRPARSITITELDGETSSIRLGRELQFNLKGSLAAGDQAAKGPWQLQGTTALELSEDGALAPRFNLELTAKDLDLNSLHAVFDEQSADDFIKGTSELQLHIDGSPDKVINVQAGLSSSDLALRPGPDYSEPIRLKSLLASGQLQIHGDQPGISNLALQVDQTRLAGSIRWLQDGATPATTFTLANNNLAVAEIKQWLPDLGQPWPSIHNNLPARGSVQLDRAEIVLSRNAQKLSEWQLKQVKGKLLQMAWEFEKAPPAQIDTMTFTLTDKHWQVSDGKARLGSVPLTINGEGTYLQEAPGVTTLDFTAEVTPELLLEEWHIPQGPLSSVGNIEVNGHLEGPLSELSLDLQADLSQFSISHPAGLDLTPEGGDKLALHATVTPEKISLDHGALKWSVAKGHLSGSYQPKDPDSLAIEALLTMNDLTRFAQYVPLLERLKLHGQADVSISQKGSLTHNLPEITLTLRDAGLHATRFIADISQINGRAKLTADGLSAENLQVHLGKSPLTVQAQLNDFSNPRLSLDVKAPSVRAEDLIFSSKKALLRDIEGHLDIDRDGLTFAQVNTRLDRGTSATVRGTISFHPPFDVLLDINSEYADIGEVINLWTDRSHTTKRQPEADEKEQKDQQHSTVKINARVKKGDLYGMSFHDASGIIAPTRERLTIHPLDFSVSEGQCNAQVLIDFAKRNKPTLLRVSGHAEGVDALEVYRELLNQKSVVRGKLRGDFYLSGETGSNFLPSSYGRFSIRVDDGVLHEFPVLSKILSLLNVSQIFALKLPDMDLEGMPFDVLTANFQLDGGTLKSDDLKIESEAMNQSYSGQLDMISRESDFSVAIHPLGTVDKIISRIPVAGWLLTGEDRALLTAHFAVKGKADQISINAMPLETISEPTLGLLKRTLSLPFKLAEDPQILWGGDGTKTSDEAD